MTSGPSTASRPARTWWIGLGVVLALVLVVVVVHRRVSDGGAQARAEARWEATEPTAYSFDFGYCGGFCQGCTTRVTVESGEVVSAVAAEPGGCTDYGVEDAPTIEDVFDQVERLRHDGTYVSHEIRYDPTWGFPASAGFDCAEGTSDCGAGLAVADFRVERP